MRHLFERFEPLLPKVNVLAKGLANLFKISKELELYKYLLDMKKSNRRVLVHYQCRRKFTDSYQERNSNSLPSKKLRSSSDTV